jgi:hypothetical protein
MREKPAKINFLEIHFKNKKPPAEGERAHHMLIEELLFI